MGPIEYAICQISFKVEKIYKDEKFAREIQHLASDVSSVERSPEDWETNEYLQKIQDFSNSINKELKDKNIDN